MAAEDERTEFDDWLDRKLNDLDVDTQVYGSYIKGVLEEENSDDLKDALEDVLSALVEDPVSLCEQVLSRWRPFTPVLDKSADLKKNSVQDIIAAHSAKVVVEKPNVQKSSDVDVSLKRALLDKYSEVYDEADESVGEEKSDHKNVKSIAPITLGLFHNVNVKSVTDAEKQKRERQKEDHHKKKEKDKMDREKQKLKKEERKEKEKKRTQKKERSAR